MTEIINTTIHRHNNANIYIFSKNTSNKHATKINVFSNQKIVNFREKLQTSNHPREKFLLEKNCDIYDFYYFILTLTALK